MYFPKRFRLDDAIRLAELVALAYDQRHASQEGRAWTLPPKLALRGELSYPAKPGGSATIPAGYVAQQGSTAYVIFSGTETPEEWVKNLKIKLVPHEVGGNVHAGFQEIYAGFRDRLLELVAGRAGTVVCAGHSLGSSFATFAALDIELKLNRRVAALYTFASPRLGDGVFAEAFNRGFEKRSFRVVNTSDVVPSLPPPCPVCAFGGYFSHVGTPVDFTVQKNDLRDNHRLETYRSELTRERRTPWWRLG